MEAQAQIHDAVLGGDGRSPAPGALVLGNGERYARLLDRFNAEAKACNKHYLRLELSPTVALIRKRRASPLDDIKVKVKTRRDELCLSLDRVGIYSYWAFAGYLKHDGLIFGHRAKYDPTRCDTELRDLALKALRGAK